MRSDAVRLPLKRQGSGIAEFAIVGVAMDEEVWARWDGQALEMHPILYSLFCLSWAVEKLFVDFGWEERCKTSEDTSYNVAVEIIRSLDHLSCLDYRSEQCVYHRIW